MENNQPNNVLFKYIEENKVKNPSLLKKAILSGLYFAGFMFLFTLSRTINSGEWIQSSVRWVLVGLAFGGLMYLIMALVDRRARVYKEENLTTPIPVGIGQVITQFYVTNSQTDEIERRLAIGGFMIVGVKGLAFIPHRFNWSKKPKALELFWTDVASIYRGSGSLPNFDYTLLGRHINKISYRLVIETKTEVHYFSTEYIDQLVDDLNKLAA